jgi:hypothetical protein
MRLQNQITMREYTKKPESQSRTLDSNPKASRQAPTDVILQRYKERNIQRYAEDEELIQGKFDTAQRNEIDEDELLQGKFDTAQRNEIDEDELLQGKFDTAQREDIDEDELLQGKFDASTAQREKIPSEGGKANLTGMPDNLKSGIESLSGYSMDDVRVHYNSSKPAQLQALAYAQGTDIHVAPGQEQHLPHEAWHVVQQKQGRVQPTMQLQGVNVNDNEGLEKEADVMGGGALRIKNVNEKILKNNNTDKADINNRVIQGDFYVKEGDRYIWQWEKVNENLYINTGEQKVYEEDCDENFLSNLFYPEVRHTHAKEEEKTKYSVYKKRVLDMTGHSTRKSNEDAKKAKESGEIKDMESFQTTQSVYTELTLKQQILFNKYLNNIRPYCDKDGITGLIEGALKNVKKGSILSIQNDRAKQIFINRLMLMTEYVKNVGEKVIGGQKIKDKFFIESTGSDPHANGHHALFLINRDDPKKRIVYKPHSLKFENAFMGKDGFLDYLNSLNSEGTKKFATMGIDTTTHTEEFISRVGDKDSPIKDEKFKEYMEKLGMLQTASHVFGITDLHCENIIFGDDGPVAIDAECGGAFYTETGIEKGVSPVKTDESDLLNPSALYVGGQQKKDKGAEYEKGKLDMSKIIKDNKHVILEKSKKLLDTIDRFRILPFGTDLLAYFLNIYIEKGKFENDFLKTLNDIFFNYFNESPLFEGNVILELDEFDIFFFDAIRKGTLPSFEFDLENKVILLDNYRVGHVKPGIDIKQCMINRMQIRIDGLQVPTTSPPSSTPPSSTS